MGRNQDRKIILTPSQCEFYATQGYLVLHNFFHAKTVSLMQSELDRLIAEGQGYNAMPETTGKVNYIVRELDKKSPSLYALHAYPDLIKIIKILIGEPALLWYDQLYLKPARVGFGNIWHDDNTCFQATDPEKGIGVWIAVHDSTQDNGTLEVVPKAFGQDVQQAQVLPLEAGGLVLFNFAMYHSTKDNLSSTDRASLVFHYLNEAYQPADLKAVSMGRKMII